MSLSVVLAEISLSVVFVKVSLSAVFVKVTLSAVFVKVSLSAGFEAVSLSVVFVEVSLSVFFAAVLLPVVLAEVSPSLCHVCFQGCLHALEHKFTTNLVYIASITIAFAVIQVGCSCPSLQCISSAVNLQGGL